MPDVTYHTRERTQTLELRIGQSVMEGAVRNGIAGILAECGGSCMCATCHVYVESGLVKALPLMSDDEDAMLSESAAERRPNSRLACQIRMTEALAGLVVRVADNA